jgi:hypothetical protein
METNTIEKKNKTYKTYKIILIISGVVIALIAVFAFITFFPMGFLFGAISVLCFLASAQLNKAIADLNVVAKIKNIGEYFNLTDEIAKARAEHENYIAQENKKHNEYIASTNKELEKVKEETEKLKVYLKKLNSEASQKKNEIIVLDNQITLQEFGLYTPVYDFANSEEYKNKLELVRTKQKEMIRNDTAATYSTTFTLNNSAAQGKKMVKDNVKQILRSFNNECETLIDKAKFNNVEAIRSRIMKSYETLNKLNVLMNIKISNGYLELKLQELNLAYEYALKKQQEKEDEKERRAELREAAKLERELAEERKKIEKEQQHYQQALKNILEQLNNSTSENKAELEAKRAEIEGHLTEIDTSIKNIDYRESNQKAGYVYVISNIGAFGENVYKIGMTRRLDPMDRVDELGDASVPFNFDVHAMIFSDNAPALEAALHRAFENKKLNMINTRREFFNVTLEEIEEVVKANFDKTVEFVKNPPAEQYRESLKIKEAL